MASAQPFPLPPKVSSPTTRITHTNGSNPSRNVNPKKTSAPLNIHPMMNRQINRKGANHKSLNQIKTTDNSVKSRVTPSAKVQHLPSPKRPLWLQGLISLHFISSCTTFVLIGSALGVYGWTVYTQQAWGRAYHDLETLQRYERQLTTTNETIKNDLAQQAEEPQMGLIDPNPHTTIFLKPASDRLNASPSAPVQEDSSLSEMDPAHSIPLGY
jgi:hypothetical protein